MSETEYVERTRDVSTKGVRYLQLFHVARVVQSTNSLSEHYFFLRIQEATIVSKDGEHCQQIAVGMQIGQRDRSGREPSAAKPPMCVPVHITPEENEPVHRSHKKNEH